MPSAHQPVLTCKSVREEYAHVSRQRCVCGSTYTITDERIDRDPVTDKPVHVLEAGCLNQDCPETVTFRFAVGPLLGGGLGCVLADTVRVDQLRDLFPQLETTQEAAMRIAAAWIGLRASGGTDAALDRLLGDVAAAFPRANCVHVRTWLEDAYNLTLELAIALDPAAGPKQCPRGLD